jgi:mRNA interferase MazF
LVVAVPDVPSGPGLLWVLMVTSSANRGWPGDVLVSDLNAAGLPAPAVVRPAKIATIEARDAERLGHLSHVDRDAVSKGLRNSLGTVLGRASLQAAPPAD